MYTNNKILYINRVKFMTLDIYLQQHFSMQVMRKTEIITYMFNPINYTSPTFDNSQPVKQCKKKQQFEALDKITLVIIFL